MQHYTCWISLDLDITLVNFIMKNYSFTREWNEANWLDPLVTIQICCQIAASRTSSLKSLSILKVLCACQLQTRHSSLSIRAAAEASPGINIISCWINIISPGINIISPEIYIISCWINIISPGINIISPEINVISHWINITSPGINITIFCNNFILPGECARETRKS